jgi:hypothetical protein
MTTLRDARKGNLEDFIREHEKDAPGDLDKLDAALKHPSQGTSKATQAASKPDGSDDCT